MIAERGLQVRPSVIPPDFQMKSVAFVRFAARPAESRKVGDLRVRFVVRRSDAESGIDQGNEPVSRLGRPEFNSGTGKFEGYLRSVTA